MLDVHYEAYLSADSQRKEAQEGWRVRWCCEIGGFKRVGFEIRRLGVGFAWVFGKLFTPPLKYILNKLKTKSNIAWDIWWVLVGYFLDMSENMLGLLF